MSEDIKLTALLDGGMWIEEVFYRDDRVGDVFQYEDEPTWYYRTPYSMMWWRALDKDDAISRLLDIKGIIS